MGCIRATRKKPVWTLAYGWLQLVYILLRFFTKLVCLTITPDTSSLSNTNNGKTHCTPKGECRFELWRRYCWGGSPRTPNICKTDMENIQKKKKKTLNWWCVVRGQIFSVEREGRLSYIFMRAKMQFHHCIGIYL